MTSSVCVISNRATPHIRRHRKSLENSQQSPFTVKFKMTTTDCYTGVGDGERNSSRVLRPPGGGSSDIFGSGSVGHTKSAAEEQKQNSAKAAAGSNIFGGPMDNSEDGSGVKHINRKSQPSSQSTIFGGGPSANASDLKKRDKEGEEFPAYDRSVYAAQMTPQRRNIQQVSSYNPITNESYTGEEQQQDQQATAKRRGQNNVNQVSSYNVITNHSYEDENSYQQATPQKPGKRTLSNSKEEGHSRVAGLEQKNTGTYNPITGELIGNKDDGPQRNSSRVINPPGGKSTGLW
ncbi:microtubule-associated protein Jupiter-like isoform X3 [Mytilus trossulus]|uniref:microtubule-associated protein Jupiter-like isoform X3 n=1 Tax=Mytilus trossulus TaxID=6551 RepID=UPI0030055877